MASLGASIATTAISGLASRRSNRRNQANVSGILGGFNPAGFSSGGLQGGFQDNQFSVTRTGRASGLTGERSSAVNQRAGDLRGFAERLDPIYGDVTQAGVGALRANRQRTVGNLQQSLQRRRVLGSSFAQDAISRAEAEFAQREGELRSQMQLQSIQSQAQLTDQANQAQIENVQNQITQMNFESNVAPQLSGQATGAINSSNQLNAQLQANLGQQETDLYGSIFGAGLTGIGANLNSGSSGGFMSSLNSRFRGK